ncbi:coiled-coil domain-containing protein 112 isoform X2 [Engraulis encrasicolus]|uniref:coiled-coil domain-containing protein 112 isoform X2 n=1 Tax=Engraulis encrasicolus TaxID=184585 RepID=UPI002FD603D5
MIVTHQCVLSARSNCFIHSGIKVEQQLVKLRHGVRGFQEQLTDVKPSSELVEKLQAIMTEVETAMNSFKLDQHQSFEELLKEERVCCQEIAAFEKKMELWSHTDKPEPVPHTAPSGKVHVTPSIQSDAVPPEVKALDAFLQQTGVYGRWDQYDHQSFLQIWTKHGGRPSYLREAMAYLPARSQQEVLQHEEWYLKLQDLQEKKKLAILKWRTEKEREKEERLQQREEVLDSERWQREEEAQRRRQRSEEEKKKEAAARLVEWRSQRQLREEQEEDRRVKEEAQLKRRQQEERRRQQEARLAVQACVRQKKQQAEQRLAEAAARERAEVEERRKAGAQLIQQFQERDLHRLETKLSQKQQKEEQDLERKKQLEKLKEKVEAHITRDQSRLLRPTKGWEEHMKNIGPTGGGPVYQPFHRAVPSWRQDV